MSRSPYGDQERDGDYDEYDENLLFEEFVERAEDNFGDPELQVINSLLKERGFRIKAENLGRRILADELTGARTVKVTANLALVDYRSGEVVAALLQRTLSAPLLTAKPIRQDDEFLKEARICW